MQRCVVLHWDVSCAHLRACQFREYLEQHGFDTSGMGFIDGTETHNSSIPEEFNEKEKEAA